MQAVIIVIHLLVVLAMIGFVLLQKSEGGGLGIGGGGGFMTSRGTANVLSRTTAILAAVFFLTSLGLNILAGLSRAPKTLVPGGAPTSQTEPGAPVAPPLGGGQGGGVLNQLGGGSPQPAAPSGPQVPRSQ